MTAKTQTKSSKKIEQLKQSNKLNKNILIAKTIKQTKQKYTHCYLLPLRLLFFITNDNQFTQRKAKKFYNSQTNYEWIEESTMNGLGFQLEKILE